jgi:ribosomal protein S18 acetylase RimI-like enzyme
VIAIEKARPEDPPQIAAAHVAAWRETYVGLVPQPVLDGLDPAARERMWRRHLEQGRPLAVAREADGIVGFAAGGSCQECLPGFAAELYAIYLLRRAQRRGVGTRLFEAVRTSLAAAGFGDLTLWVFADNRLARSFYEKRGGVMVGERTIEIGGRSIAERAYAWRPLTIDPPPAK